MTYLIRSITQWDRNEQPLRIDFAVGYYYPLQDSESQLQLQYRWTTLRNFTDLDSAAAWVHYLNGGAL